jgi:uncharacterized protein YlaN (UPF0358 family)
MTIHKEMWADFNDYELAKLCYMYGIEEELVFNDNLTLANRDQVEKMLTDFEMDIAAAGEYL